MTKLDEKKHAKTIFGFKLQDESLVKPSVPATHTDHQKSLYTKEAATEELRILSGLHSAQTTTQKNKRNHASLAIKLVALAVIISSLSFILPQYSLLRCLSNFF